MKRLSNIMILAMFLSTLFYSLSYPYIYAELLKVVPKGYISIEQILCCIGTIICCKIWNKYSDRLFKYYGVMLWIEMIADIVLFLDVQIRHDLCDYFLINIIIYSIITRNLVCGGNKMRARLNPNEKDRERFDNNNTVANSIGTVMGAGIAIILSLKLNSLFILTLIGNIIDNIFYLYIYKKLNHIEVETA